MAPSHIEVTADGFAPEQERVLSKVLCSAAAGGLALIVSVRT